jgi:hypothetical protein
MHTMFYIFLKRQEILIYATIHINLENTLKSQSQKRKLFCDSTSKWSKSGVSGTHLSTWEAETGES